MIAPASALFNIINLRGSRSIMNIMLLLAPGLPPTIPVWGLAHLCGLLRSLGHDAHVIDFNLHYGLPMPQDGADWWDIGFAEKFFASKPELKNRLLQDIMANKPDMVAFSAFKCCAGSTLYLGRELKKQAKPPFVVFGGPQACRLPRQSEFSDALVPGEGELALLDILELAQGRRAWGPVPGAILLRGQEAVFGGPPKLYPNPDSLPMPDFSDYDLPAYSTGMVPFSFNRGCANNCCFCTTRSLWPNFRSLSAKRIYQEMLNTTSKFGAKHLFASCTAVNLNPAVLEELCDRIIAGGIRLSWEGLGVFGPELTPELIRKLVKSGCSGLGFGLESASDRILSKMGKPYTAEIAEKVIRDCFAAGLHLNVNVILGFPGETVEDVEHTKSFLERNGKYIFGGVSYPHECGIGGNSPMNLEPEKYGIDPATLGDRLSWVSLDKKQTHESRLKLIEEFAAWARKLGLRIHEPPIAPPQIHMDSPKDPPPYGKT